VREGRDGSQEGKTLRGPLFCAGLHEVVGDLKAGNETAARRPLFVVKSHPLPLTKSESVSLDSILLVLGAVFVLVSSRPFSPSHCSSGSFLPLSSSPHAWIHVCVCARARVCACVYVCVYVCCGALYGGFFSMAGVFSFRQFPGRTLWVWGGPHAPAFAVAKFSMDKRRPFAMMSRVLRLTVLRGTKVPFCYLSGAFCINPVSERISGAQHLQLLSGCPATAYWAGSYAFDYMLWLGITGASMLIFLAYGDKATVGTLAQAEGTLVLLLMYGASVIPLSYSFSHSFSSPSAAQVRAPAVPLRSPWIFLAPHPQCTHASLFHL
jgi:ABC-2 family transporter protein